MESPNQRAMAEVCSASLNRRTFLRQSGAFAGLGALGLAGCGKQVHPPGATANQTAPPLPFYDAVAPIIPIRAHADRIFRITVCLRPFRAAGPRLEVERVGDKYVVHNYGHGGSGWSLSWGSGAMAVDLAMSAAGPQTEVAVVGCGALGLTAATLLQRAGVRVVIYAKERPPFVRSSRATGSWTPDSRVALASAAAPDFGAKWEAMARSSFSMYQSYLGVEGNPIEWTDRYTLSDSDTPRQTSSGQPGLDAQDFIRLNSRIADLTPRRQLLPPGATPFPTRYVWRNTSLTFNVADYSRRLVNDFLIAGGRIETREFHAPGELASLPQTVIVNCTGYAARDLWKDTTLTPVRGQIAWLIPQEGVNYGINYGNLNVLGRRDGIVIQPAAQGDATGWNDSNEQPDRAEAEAGVAELAALYARMEKRSAALRA